MKRLFSCLLALMLLLGMVIAEEEVVLTSAALAKGSSALATRARSLNTGLTSSRILT